jgi:hypothetical protein
VNREIISLIVNGLLAAGILAGYFLHRIDLATAVALLIAASAPGGGDALLRRLADGLKKDEPPAPPKDGAP